MSSIDQRIVEMRLENAQFQQGVAQTLASLQKLNQGLKLDGATKGLQSVGQAATAQHASIKNIEAGVQTLSTKFQTGFQTAKSAMASATQTTQGMVDGLAKVGATADKQTASIKNIENSVSTVASKFTALGQIATGALHNIGAQAVAAGGRLVKSLSLDPVMEGFREYETNLNSIQTILANTRAAGTNLQDVTHALDELNHYSDQTIYNFSEMAKNIGTFTAAGVGLEESTAAIKGIANLAAVSGSNSEQASAAMYQLSQAISAGRVSLEDWNSVVNAGMGGTVFQRALAQNAVALGTLSEGAVKLKGDMKNVSIEGKSFRESITAKPGQESWLTSKVLTQTLAQFTGDLSDAELAAQGFSKAQIKAIQDQAKTAKAAATEVKTLTQLMSTFRESITSGWAQTWTIIFGDFNEAKGLFTGVSEAIGGMLQQSADGRNKMLKEWDSLGGRTALIESIANVFKALVSVVKPIRDAFREIFPATTGKQLADMTKQFRDFTERLTIGGETADKLRRTFAGVFAIFGIAVDIIKEVVRTIFDLVGVATQGSGGFLEFTAKIGDWIVAVRNGLKEGEGLKNLFKGIGTVLAIPIKLVQKLAGFLSTLFKDSDASGVEKSVEGVSKSLEPLGRIGEMVSAIWGKVLDVMHNVGDFFSGLGDRLASFFESIGIGVSGMFDGLNFDDVLSGINTGLFASLVLMLRNFLGGGGPAGMVDKLSDALDGLTGTLDGIQNTLKAATLLQIALAVGILALSMNTLSKIDREGLIQASAAISVMFGQLLGAMVIFQKFIGFAGFAKLPFIMGSLILLALAVLILAQAVKQLAALDWNELAKGLTGLAVTLGLLVGALKFMPNPKGLISTGLGVIVLAAGIKILASAVVDLSAIGWNELAKGLVGVGALLGALVLFTMFAKANKGGIVQGAGIILLAAGIKILASAVKDMSKMSWGEIAKGLVTLAGALAIITGALMLIPPTAPLAALGVLGVAISLGMIAKALDEMAQMSWGNIGSSLTVMLGALTIIAAALYVIPPTAPLAAAGILITALALQQVAKVLSAFSEYSWEEIGKSMLMLAGTLGIIAGAMLLMTGALPGAAALLIISAALMVLAPVLMQFSQMSLAEIGTALLMLAGVFLVFGAAALLLAPVVPLMIALAAAVALLGIGLLAAGAGVFLFATGLTALAAAGAAGAAAVIGIVSGLIGLIPKLMEEIGKGIIAFAKVIATGGPAITQAITVVLQSLISAIGRLTPQIVNTLLRMLTQMLQAMANYVPKMVDAGLKMLTGILTGIANNIGKVVDAATKVTVNFINGVARNLPKIIQSGVNLILSFINGLTRAIDQNSSALGQAGGRLAVAIIRGMVNGLRSGVGEIVSAAKNVASSALNSAMDVLGINSPSKEFEKIGKFVIDGFRKGLDGNKGQIDKAFNDLKKMLLDLSKSSKASASERKKAAAAYSELTKKLNDERSALGKLSNQYDKLTEKIKKAEETLANAIKTRDDYRKQIADQYSDMPTPDKDQKVADYVKDLQEQIEKTKQFANTLQRLRKLGLNDETYKDLLAQGIDGLPFANELLAGGPEAINQINELSKQLDAAGGQLGKQASISLYQAGVDAAQGMVDGLKAKQKAIEKIMDTIAASMIKALKKKLGIKSPSVEMAKLGAFSAEGLAEGMRGMTGIIERAADGNGKAALEAMRKSLTNMSDLVVGPLDVRPTITPVLDLSNVKKNAGQIGTMLATGPISVDSAYAKAIGVARSRMTESSTTSQNVSDSRPNTVTYVQNNTSPKALSAAEIYRQTKNQLSITSKNLSTAKGALDQ